MTTGHYEDDKLGSVRFVPYREDPDTAQEKAQESAAVQDHIDADRSTQFVTIRDINGETLEAQYIRRLTANGYEKFHIALTFAKGHYSVSELSSGACLSESQDMYVALQIAQYQLASKTPKKMRRAIDDICARLGTLPGTIRTIPASSNSQGESQ